MGTVVHLTDQSLQLSASNWNSTYTTVCSLSVLWEESNEIIPTVVNYLSTTENVTISSLRVTDLRVLSSLFVEGTATFLETQTLTINDPIIFIAENNQSDILDVGLAAAWSNPPGFPSGYQYGGLVRRADNKFWTLFSGITAQPLSSINLDWTLSGVTLEPLSAKFYGDIYGNRYVFGNLNITNGLTVDNGLTVSGNISGYGLKTSFNQGLATGNYSFAINAGKATGSFSYAEGKTTTALGSASHAEGELTFAFGPYSHAEGYATSAIGEQSHAKGFKTLAFGNTSYAEGILTIASASASHTEGGLTLANQEYSHAEGYATSAIGTQSHAEGGFTLASGQASHAEGENTRALGQASHAEGESTRASGPGSHTEGGDTSAAGSYSHAEGKFSNAQALISHAAGYRATAAHGYAYIWSGDSTLTNNISTTRTGQYMISAPGGVFIPGKVGIGTNNIQNALTVVGLISTVGGNSDQWNTTFNTVCAIAGGSTSQWNSTYNTVYALSSQWNSTYNTVCALSALWEESAEIVPTVTNYLSTNSIILCSIDVKGQILSGGTDLYNIFSTLDTDAQTLTYVPSSYELGISNGNTVSLSSINSTVASNSGFWQSTYAIVSSLSSTWGGTSTIELSTVTNYLSTNTVTLCSLDVKGQILSANNDLLNIFLPTTTFAGSTGNYIIQGGNTVNTGLSVGTNTGQSLSLETNNIARLTVLSSGEVGIGVISPNQQLTVAGSISTTGTFLGKAQDSVLSISSTNTVQNSTIAIAISTINLGLQLLVPPPTYIAPVATLTNFNPSTFEVGATVSRNLVLGFTQNDAGAPTQFEIFKNSTSLLAQTLPFTQVVSESAALGITTYRNTVTYSAGPIKNNILGLPDARNSIVAGVSSVNQAYTGLYRRWIGSVATFPSSPDSVRTLALSTSLDNNNTMASPTSPIRIDNKFILIAIPDTRVLTTVVTETNETLTPQFNLSSVQIPDAGGTYRAYKLYYLETALPLNANLTNVTIANV